MTQWTEKKLMWLSIKWFATLLVVWSGLVFLPYNIMIDRFYTFYFCAYLFGIPMILFKIWTGYFFTPYTGADQLVGKIFVTLAVWGMLGIFFMFDDIKSDFDMTDNILLNICYPFFLACVWMPSVFGRWERFFKWIPVVIYSLFMIYGLIFVGGLIWAMCLES